MRSRRTGASGWGRASALPPAEQDIARQVDEGEVILARLDWEPPQPSTVVRSLGDHLDHDLPSVLAGETAVESMSRMLETVDHGLRGVQGAGAESLRQLSDDLCVPIHVIENDESS